MRGRTSGLAVLLVLMVAPMACSDEGSGDGPNIVAAVFPLAEAARAVGGPDVTVHDLTPRGVEPHDLELTPRQRDRVEDADVVVLVGGGFQPALEDALDGADVKVVDAKPKDERDPHVWLDPTRMAALADELAAALAGIDSERTAAYRRRAAAFSAQMTAVDQRYRAGLESCQRRVIVTAHEAFGHLARRYGLEQHAVAGLEPDIEPDPRRLAALTDFIRARGVTTVFTEELVSPRVAETLAREAAVETAVLDPIEGGDDGYVEAMEANLATLRQALGCR